MPTEKPLWNCRIHFTWKDEPVSKSLSKDDLMRIRDEHATPLAKWLVETNHTIEGIFELLIRRCDQKAVLVAQESIKQNPSLEEEMRRSFGNEVSEIMFNITGTKLMTLQKG